MLADNIVFLKKEYPYIYQAIKSWETKNEAPKFSIEKANDGNSTLKYKDDKRIVYLHSKYNPIVEAQKIINDLKNRDEISDEAYVLFYGIGLGYHIKYFCEEFPDTTFSIIEPSIEILDCFLKINKLDKFNIRKLGFIHLNNNINEIYNEIVLNFEKKIVLCVLPVYKGVFKEEYARFSGLLKEIVKEKKGSLKTNYAFQKRWILNSVNNFKEVLKTANILIEHKHIFKGKTAILVAAGPSVEFETDNLRKIKNDGLAFMFSVGSAIDALIKNDIYPHALCTYDPTEKNQHVFDKFNDRNINNIPMIFGSSVGYETLEQYKGPKYHMVTTQDTIADYFLKSSQNEIIEKVNDAPSIAVVTLELLAKLEFSKIILVGQNFASLEAKADSKVIDDAITTENVEGKMVNTTESYLSMKKLMEQTIAKYRLDVINTTVGGAKIEGTSFRFLKDIIEEKLIYKEVNEDEFESINKPTNYDKTNMNEQIIKLTNEYAVYNDLVLRIQNYLNKLKELLKTKNESQLRKIHVEMEQLIKKMEINSFFKVIVLPTCRVEYGLLVNEVDVTRNEKIYIQKVKRIINPTERFINTLFASGELYKNIMSVLKNVIESYDKGEL
ncbi:motility associated factor glycosyltransferase family protein [Acetobacterium woodii]|uniref:6-hydroxymethylpterin diphosphokinase MptE-like domain-containing protein n=1 Tax=Acetobacterium woodii (strain ATCC 29683 / DSM 1030 / JCM 2381 / KCTC 1655 / WB1) TaxID=931626 RepID=H6LDT3_ACEWD|nr:6-hydroxymethylpterin diphosphokinase MptE-like protein [Acetobacterium woodii]AFA49247.1 hypothetical protein Awo_c24900 [Acetobacterium woodii DSM 1030]